jgi:phosphoserine aminotransferase
MTTVKKPAARPANPRFSSGPCAKRPGWSPENFDLSLLGRSHRSKPGKARLKLAIDETRKILQVPDDYLIGIVPASDTGAVEMALWSLLGARPVDVLVWESFGKEWATDIVKQLKLKDARVMEAPYGQLPDLSKVDFGHDVVFTWNGTTSGVRVPNGDWIADKRDGLVICDATSAAFAQNIAWTKLDVVTYSWQKVLGGEAAHGMLILSPRAVKRLETYKPAWPLPKIFRLAKYSADGNKLIGGIFEGETINTPSMLALEDYIDALKWAADNGGLKGMMKRADDNLKAIAAWAKKAKWVDFLCADEASRSNTSVCLKIVDPAVAGLDADGQAAFAKKLVSLLDKEGVAYDLGAYRDAPPGLRIWAGATVEKDDLKALFPWLDWAFATARAELAKS